MARGCRATSGCLKCASDFQRASRGAATAEIHRRPWHAACVCFVCIMRSLCFLLLIFVACSPPPCDGTRQPYRDTLACSEQFAGQAARPQDTALPLALTVKTVLTEGRLYFQDSATYPTHRDFAVAQLGYPRGMPFVDEYLQPQRRLLLGAVTRYEGPDVWAYELAPYDTASPEQVAQAFRAIQQAVYFGRLLRLHVTSPEQQQRLAGLNGDIPTVTSDAIYAGTSYQPLNLGTTVAQVRLTTAQALPSEAIGPRELVVLDRAPFDISVVAGIVTAEPQTPLSHVNVLSQQRGTPNMALRDAPSVFGPHDRRWVRLRVGPFDYSIEPVSADEAEAFWREHRPKTVTPPPPDYAVVALPSLDEVGLSDLPAIGGKAAHFGELRSLSRQQPDVVRVPRGFTIPVHYYRQFVHDNGIDRGLTALLVDERFRSDGLYQRQRLEALQATMLAAPVDATLLQTIEARLARDFPGRRMRFRSSTTAEDLEGHSGAGLYSSTSAQPGDPTRTIERALRTVWASLWNPRAFAEREYVGIDSLQVAMAVLVHPAYTDELANGVAITANPFDAIEDGFYINAQLGEEDVVSPAPGVIADQLVYFYFHSGQPTTYYRHSSLLPVGSTVLSRRELFDLGSALDAIRGHFATRYRQPMDVEFKLTPDRHIEIKQARPYPGRGL